MPFLIILRGPAGSGKSSLRDSIQVRLGVANTSFLNLDQIIFQDFDDNLEKSLNYEYVIGEMYSGNSHTTDPHWIQRFNDNNYTILSVILRCSLESCKQRVQSRIEHPIPPELMTVLYNRFYQELQNIFSVKAGVKEICIDTEYNSSDESSDEILKNLVSNTRLSTK